ncbi:MAG TPA: hypothetical protein PK122_05620 [Candidatus Paceibacterota bacterium]|nr:hypothetical protein [Candidatus Paceibacterota bacterium]
MSSVYIYHHLGLGDHIIANGMVRTIAKKYDRTYIFCKPHNFPNVSFMYRDLPNLKIIVMDDLGVQSFMSINPDNNYVIAGHAPFWKILNSGHNTLKIDEIFYQLAGVPLENKWKEFFVQRDTTREKEVFSKLGLKDGDRYIFVHDDQNRKITKDLPSLKVIKPWNKEFTLFDYLYTIENAEQVHCINSAFFCLIDCIGINKMAMFLHEYVRKDLNDDATPILGSNWTILK